MDYLKVLLSNNMLNHNLMINKTYQVEPSLFPMLADWRREYTMEDILMQLKKEMISPQNRKLAQPPGLSYLSSSLSLIWCFGFSYVLLHLGPYLITIICQKQCFVLWFLGGCVVKNWENKPWGIVQWSNFRFTSNSHQFESHQGYWSKYPTVNFKAPNWP